MISKAEEKNIECIINITKACEKTMVKNGVYQ